MQVGTQGRADWRVLMIAAVIGSGVGLSLGAAYLATGAARDGADGGRSDQIAQALRPALDAAVPAVAAQNVVAAATPALQPAVLGANAVEAVTAKPSKARELDCMTQAVYFEARGESQRGQAAVATVIMNRVKSPAFPKTVCGVVYQGSGRRNGCQFSFACDGMVERVVESSAWSRARKVAARTLSGAVLRDVGSATHFHTTGVAPAWGPQMLRTAQVGLHVFYRFYPNGTRRAAPATEQAVFTSAPVAAQPELRLATALSGAAAETAGSATPAHALEAKPAQKIEVPTTVAPVAKADTSAAS